MSLKEECMNLGLGCCGGKQVKELIANYDYKGMAANGSEQDLKILGNIPKYHLQHFDGFGGHRDRALDCLAQNSDFIEFIEGIEEKEELERIMLLKPDYIQGFYYGRPVSLSVFMESYEI